MTMGWGYILIYILRYISLVRGGSRGHVVVWNVIMDSAAWWWPLQLLTRTPYLNVNKSLSMTVQVTLYPQHHPDKLTCSCPSVKVVSCQMRPESPRAAASPFRDIYERCWRQDPARRPDMRGVLARLEPPPQQQQQQQQHRRSSSSIRL